ncbi:high-affinity iron permease [Podochytrium sp. JEL0797]|nr:high-affinity iron permease [Podochytrium sp. JEL0797]
MLVPFNPAALFVTLRESLEAVITVTVMLQFVQKSLEHSEPELLVRLTRHIWMGAMAGLVAAVSIGSGLVVAIWVLKRDILGSAGEVWENAFEAFAVVLQTYIALKFISFTNTNTSAMTAKWQRKINHHLESAAAQASASVDAQREPESDPEQPPPQPPQDFGKVAAKFEYPFAILAFSVVLREGMESVIYLTGISAGEHPAAIALPGLIGIMLSVSIGVIVYKCSSSIELKPLMITSVIMMLVLSAALVSEIAGEVEEYVFEEIWGIDDGTTPVLWDLTGCCDEKTVPLFQVLSALVGWKARPTVATMGAYLTYWVLIGTYVAVNKMMVAQAPVVLDCVTEEDGENDDESTPLLIEG